MLHTQVYSLHRVDEPAFRIEAEDDVHLGVDHVRSVTCHSHLLLLVLGKARINANPR